MLSTKGGAGVGSLPAVSLGTALVVHFDPAAMIGEETHSGPLPRKSAESGDDYQSSSKQPHSKGSAEVCISFRLLFTEFSLWWKRGYANSLSFEEDWRVSAGI